MVAAGLYDGTVVIWNSATGQPGSNALTGHSGSVRSVAFSPDGALLASGSDDNTIQLWDVKSGSAKGKPLTGHRGSVWIRSVAFSPDGVLLASGSVDKTIQLWNHKTTKSVSMLPIPTGTSVLQFDMSTSAWDNCLENGWLKGPCGELILWIPPAYSPHKYHPQLMIILGEEGHLVPHINTDRLVLGTDWAKCHPF
ncbi:WD40 repeat-like protein [Clavulina sp. PMI_390]|nr:WD40 repeat-like protein [Clavulina sp. PMI_390]